MGRDYSAANRAPAAWPRLAIGATVVSMVLSLLHVASFFWGFDPITEGVLILTTLLLSSISLIICILSVAVLEGGKFQWIRRGAMVGALLGALSLAAAVLAFIASSLA